MHSGIKRSTLVTQDWNWSPKINTGIPGSILKTKNQHLNPGIYTGIPVFTLESKDLRCYPRIHIPKIHTGTLRTRTQSRDTDWPTLESQDPHCNLNIINKILEFTKNFKIYTGITWIFVAIISFTLKLKNPHIRIPRSIPIIHTKIQQSILLSLTIVWGPP